MGLLFINTSLVGESVDEGGVTVEVEYDRFVGREHVDELLLLHAVAVVVDALQAHEVYYVDDSNLHARSLCWE